MIYHTIEDTSLYERKYREKNYNVEEKEFYARINEISKTNLLYKDKYRLYWEFTQEKKLHNYEDIDIIQERIKSNNGVAHTVSSTEFFKEAMKREEVTNSQQSRSAVRSGLKDNEDEEKILPEDPIKESLITIKSERLNMLVTPMSLPIKNWVISLRKSFALDPSNKSIYPTRLAFDANSSILIVGSNEGTIYIFDYKSGIITKKFDKQSMYIRALCYLKDGVSFLSGSREGKVIRWFLNGGEHMEYTFNQSLCGVSTIVYTDNCESVLIAVGDCIFLLDLITFQKDRDFCIKLGSTLSCMVWEGKFLITGHDNGELNIIDYQNKQVMHNFKEQSQRIKDISICSYGSIPAIVACSKDQSVKIYSLDQFNLVKNLQVTSDNSVPTSLVYCHDSKTVIVSYSNGKFFTVNFLTGKKKYSYSKESKITASIYTGDSSTLIFGNKEGNIDIFSVK